MNNVTRCKQTRLVCSLGPYVLHISFSFTARMLFLEAALLAIIVRSRALYVHGTPGPMMSCCFATRLSVLQNSYKSTRCLPP